MHAAHPLSLSCPLIQPPAHSLTHSLTQLTHYVYWQPHTHESPCTPLVPFWWAVDITLHRGLEGMISDDVDSSPPTSRHASDAPAAAGSEAPSPQPQNPPPRASRGREGMEGSGGVQPRRGGGRFILPEIPPWSGRNVARTQGDRESSVTIQSSSGTTQSSSGTTPGGTPAASLQEQHTRDLLAEAALRRRGGAGDGGANAGGSD